MGQDVDRRLRAIDGPGAPEALRSLPEVALLRQIFAQHYEKKKDQVQWRDGPAVANNERVVSPYDPDARSSRKRATIWLGYKVHLTETCEEARAGATSDHSCGDDACDASRQRGPRTNPGTVASQRTSPL